jgi:hypothetical protein
MEMSGHIHIPATLSSGKERAPGTHCIGGWVGPRAILDTVAKENDIPTPALNWTMVVKLSFSLKQDFNYCVWGWVPVTTAWDSLGLWMEETTSRYEGQLWMYWISSWRLPTEVGPPAWVLGKGLTIPHYKKPSCYKMLNRALYLRALVNTVMKLWVP